MKRLITAKDDFQGVIDYVKNQLTSLDLFNPPSNEKTEDNFYQCDLYLKDELKDAFIIIGIGTKFDNLLNTTKNQYQAQVSINVKDKNIFNLQIKQESSN